MGVALMADIPNQAVIRCIENSVQSNGQLDNAKTSAQMAACFGYGSDSGLAQFVSERFKLLVTKAAHIGRQVDLIEK